MPQHCFLLDHDGEILVDRIGRLENFQTDANDILDQLGLAGSLQLGHDNRSKRLPTGHYFADAEAVEMVADLYADDIKLLGYQYVDLNG